MTCEYRTIHHESQFCNELATIEPDARRADEYVEIANELTINPTLGTH